MHDFASRYQVVRNKIEEEAKKSGRNASEIRLIAVSKTQPADAVRDALREGLVHFGENKVQEARGKIEEIARGIWHLIGHLQKNKVRDAVRLFDSIDSVDSLELAEEIARHAESAGKTQGILLQINIAGESTKFGCHPEAAQRLAEEFNRLPRLGLQGLMAIAPFSPDPEKSRRHFAALRELRDKIQARTGLQLPVLSMGMSGDYAIAVEEGSTSLRVGTALFGERRKLRQQRPEDPGFIEST